MILIFSGNTMVLIKKNGSFVQLSGLSASGRPYDRDEFPFHDLKIDVFQSGSFPVQGMVGETDLV